MKNSLEEVLQAVEAEQALVSKIHFPDKEDNSVSQEQDKIGIESIADIESAKISSSRPAISYSLEEQQIMAQQMYGMQHLDYDTLPYGAVAGKLGEWNSDDEYWQAKILVDTESEMISTEEAQQTFVNIQYSAAMGNNSEVNMIDKRKFDLWIKFNLAKFKLIEGMYTITRDVNYAA